VNAFESLDQHRPLFARSARRYAVSFEFFPPKTDADGRDPVEFDPDARAAPPRFVSVPTAPADRPASDPRDVERILKETALTPAAHLTCVGASRGEVDAVARDYWERESATSSLCAATRRARPKFKPHPDGYRNAPIWSRPQEGGAVRYFRAAYPKSIRIRSRNSTSTISSGRSTPARPRDHPILLLADCFFRFRTTRAAGLMWRSCPESSRLERRDDARFAQTCGQDPDWLDDLFEGSTTFPRLAS
jgi:methylenetetrahydrofolate reductase (NADPH)